MDPNNVTIWLAMLAGLASFLSPCVLALVPAYIGYLGGRSVTPQGQVVENRWVTFSHGLAFVIGFGLVFVILGAAASAIGTLLFDLREWIARIGGVVVVIFGLHTIGIINIPFLNYDTRRQVQPNEKSSYVSSGLMGVFFSAGWAPCVGPVLGAVLTLAVSGGEVSQGVFLLSAYSIGLAIPFLLAALGVGRVTELLRRHNKAIRVVSVATGVVLVIVGVMLFTGTLEQLARFGFFVDFGI
ncbi:MAG: cytochrome c biogenesis protein CcdA [Anaerolineales bacterium]|nr:cytochrome c biogenesis protein CcdA [Anaerolineales bacterium]